MFTKKVDPKSYKEIIIPNKEKNKVLEVFRSLHQSKPYSANEDQIIDSKNYGEERDTQFTSRDGAIVGGWVVLSFGSLGLILKLLLLNIEWWRRYLRLRARHVKDVKTKRSHPRKNRILQKAIQRIKSKKVDERNSRKLVT